MVFADMLADAIEGCSKIEVLRDRSETYAGAVGTVMAGGWRDKPRSAICSGGYVVHSLEASLWSIGQTSNYRDAVLLAANLGEDADTTAAITGQLAGALYGASEIPADWLDKLAWRDRIRAVAADLMRAGCTNLPL